MGNTVAVTVRRQERSLWIIWRKFAIDAREACAHARAAIAQTAEIAEEGQDLAPQEETIDANVIAVIAATAADVDIKSLPLKKLLLPIHKKKNKFVFIKSKKDVSQS